jgi:hypothetical protein
VKPLAQLAIFAVVLAAIFALSPARTASAIEHNIAGSAQLDYEYVPTAQDGNANAGTNGTFDGFTMEAALKLSVDVNEHVSSNVKLCLGCHGFDADMFYFDFRAWDELNLRVGRFSPSFGAFIVRHDPANQKLSDKPLPYDMGRMLRKSIWNNGVLPSPNPDNGAEVDGTHWFGDAAQLDYAAYAIMGFKNDTDPNPTDLNFAEAHPPNYFVDNNGRPTVGGRLAMTVKTGSAGDVSFGGSGQYGTYDPHNRFSYLILGGDLAIRVHRTNLRMEYLLRRQQMDVDDPLIFKYAVAAQGGDFFVKHGAFVELEQPIVKDLDVAARLDGMYRVGNVPVGTPLSDKSSVIRETLGFLYTLDRNFRVKTSGELWEFSDPDPVTGRTTEVSLHLGVVGTF